MKREQPNNADKRVADMSADDMLAEVAVETHNVDYLPPGYEDLEKECREPSAMATVTGRFCEPGMNVHLCETLPGTPKVAEGRFDVARCHVIHSKKLSADVAILLNDDAEAGLQPLSNVAIYLSFEQAKKLAIEILVITSQKTT